MLFLLSSFLNPALYKAAEDSLSSFQSIQPKTYNFTGTPFEAVLGPSYQVISVIVVVVAAVVPAARGCCPHERRIRWFSLASRAVPPCKMYFSAERLYTELFGASG